MNQGNSGESILCNRKKIEFFDWALTVFSNFVSIPKNSHVFTSGALITLFLNLFSSAELTGFPNVQ